MGSGRNLPKGLVTKIHQKRYPGLKLGQVWKGSMKKHIFVCDIHGEKLSIPKNIQQGKGFCNEYPCNPTAKISTTVTIELQKRYPGIKLGQVWTGCNKKHIFVCDIHGEKLCRAQQGRGFCNEYPCHPKRLKPVYIEPMPIPEVRQYLETIPVKPKHPFLWYGSSGQVTDVFESGCTG